MFANINGTKIFFDVDGASHVPHEGGLRERPTCFVLHGGPGEAHGYFKPHLDPLTDVMQLVYVDNRGSGYSAEGPPASYNLENNVNDLEALREYLGLEKIWLLGHSYGGMVAMQFAINYLERVAGLILVTTAPSYHFLEKAKRYVAEHGNSAQQEMMATLLEGKFTSNEHLNRYYEVMEPLYTRRTEVVTSKESVWKFKRSYEALNEGFAGFLRTFDVRAQLPNITVPTLVIGGKYDWITPLEDNALIARLIPNSEFVVMEHSSHSVMEEETEKFNRVVSDFVTRHSS